MKVSEVAYLAGTTVRAVRWYHAVGLLPVPEGRPRDYGFDHLARLVRIRWLAESGMSLTAIGHLLDDPSNGSSEVRAEGAPRGQAAGSPNGSPQETAASSSHGSPQGTPASSSHGSPQGRAYDSPEGSWKAPAQGSWKAPAQGSSKAPAQGSSKVPAQGAFKGADEDFDSALERIDAEIQKLTSQRNRIEGLRDLARSGATLSPLPPSIDSLYTTVRARLTNPHHIELLERDRVIASIIGAWNKLPDVTQYSATEADIEAMVEGLEIFAQAVEADDVSPLVDRFIAVYLKLASKFGVAGLADEIVDVSAEFDRLLLAMRVAYPDRKHRRFLELCLVRLGWVEPGAFDAATAALASAHGANAPDRKTDPRANASNNGANSMSTPSLSPQSMNASPRKAIKEGQQKEAQK